MVAVMVAAGDERRLAKHGPDDTEGRRDSGGRPTLRCAREMIMTHVTYWLRWLAVLPGALIAGVLLTIPLHFVLYSTLTSFIHPYPPLPERVLSPGVIAGGVVWFGAHIAPARRVDTAIALFGLWMVLLGAALSFVLAGGNIGGHSLYLQAGGLGCAGAFVGAFVGVALVRRQPESGEEPDGDPLLAGCSSGSALRQCPTEDEDHPLTSS